MLSLNRRRPRVRCQPANRGDYVTDGARLFRVIAPADPQLGTQDAVLEDCATLCWRIHTVAELWWIPMWLVRRRDEPAVEPVAVADGLGGDLRMASGPVPATLQP